MRGRAAILDGELVVTKVSPSFRLEILSSGVSCDEVADWELIIFPTAA